MIHIAAFHLKLRTIVQIQSHAMQRIAPRQGAMSYFGRHWCRMVLELNNLTIAGQLPAQLNVRRLTPEAVSRFESAVAE